MQRECKAGKEESTMTFTLTPEQTTMVDGLIQQSHQTEKYRLVPTDH
jgi:hypothetical protein